MTVKELIQSLQNEDQDSIVVITNTHFWEIPREIDTEEYSPDDDVDNYEDASAVIELFPQLKGKSFKVTTISN